MKTYSNAELARENMELYSQQVHDDVYCVRSGSGRYFHLLTREEMSEFKSSYIEGYYRYYPKDKQAVKIIKFLKNNNLSGLPITECGGELLIGEEVKLVITKTYQQC